MLHEEVPEGVPRDAVGERQGDAGKALHQVLVVPHPQRGMFRTVGCPIVLSDSPVEVKTSPLLGEHSEEVLTELLGYDKAAVAKLQAEGVL